MLPVELGAGSLRRDNFDLEKNMILQRRTTRYLNSKVKTRRFQEEDLVLRKVLHNKRALDLSWEGLYKIAGILTPCAY